MEKLQWDKVRVLVANYCNYKCPFCHNEGQDKATTKERMSLQSFKRLVDVLSDQPISEFNISGGEPFLNEDIVDMILYINDNLDCDISCATNLSLIKPEHINALSRTRIKFNIQFPFATAEAFKRSTVTGNLDRILNSIDLLRTENIQVGLNTVLQSDDFTSIPTLIDFALERGLPLKLLPQIGLSGSKLFLNHIRPMLDAIAVKTIDKNNGALKWYIEKNGKKTTVLYIDAPCFTKDIKQCRNYGELRIQPNMEVQACILGSPIETINLANSNDVIITQLNNLWKNFNHC